MCFLYKKLWNEAGLLYLVQSLLSGKTWLTREASKEFVPQTVFVRKEFIVSFIVCFNIYCVFVLKYLLFFLICALPTNIGIKEPWIIVSSTLQWSREEWQMLQWHSSGVFFWLLGVISIEALQYSACFAQSLCLPWEIIQLCDCERQQESKKNRNRRRKEDKCRQGKLRRGISCSLRDFQCLICGKFSSTSKLGRNSFQEMPSLTPSSWDSSMGQAAPGTGIRY